MRATSLLIAATLAATPLVASGQERPPVGPPTWTTSSGFPHTRAFAARPGPDAECLTLSDAYTLEEDGRIVHERHSRLAVNTYLAINRKYGETKIEYDPAVDTVEVLVNRTVLPSGQIVDAPPNAVVDDQPSSAHANPSWSGLRRKVIVHTALEPGAVIEESVRITRHRDALPWLELGEGLTLDVPVRERMISVDASEGTALRWQVTGGGQVEPEVTRARGRVVWTWRLTDRPAWSEDAATPHRPDSWPYLWASTCPSHEALEAEVGRRLAAAGAAPVELVTLARATASKAASDEVRIVRVLEAAGERLSTSSIPQALILARVRSLADVWRSGWATQAELAALQAAALRSLGYEASVAWVASPGRDLERVPALAGTERVVLAVGWPAKSFRLYDPGHADQGGPLELALSDRNILGVRPLPRHEGASGEAERKLRLQVEVAVDSSLGGTLELEARGAANPHARLLVEPEKLASELASSVKGFSARDMRVVELQRDHCTLTAALEGKLPAAGALGLVRVELGGVAGGVESRLPALPAAGRQTPVAVPGPLVESLDVTLTLPEGWTVAAAPVAQKVANAAGSVEVVSSLDGRALRVGRRLELRGAIVATPDVAALRELLVAWRSTAGRELLLRPPAGKEPAKP